MMLSLHTGSINGRAAVSKPIYIVAIMEAIEREMLPENKILISNDFIRNRFGQLYEQVNGNRKGYELSFFVRPFFHLSSAPFYQLKWKEGSAAPKSLRPLPPSTSASIFSMQSWTTSYGTCSKTQRAVNT